MASIAKWNTPGTLTTILSTQLNSLANGAMNSTASSDIANQTNLDLYADFEIVLGSLSPTSGAYIGLYFLESVDGTNFPAQSDADLRLTATQMLGAVPIGTTAATGQRVVIRNILLPPSLFRVKLDNQTGVALNASGNTVKIKPCNFNLNG
jgi:hypothetical protein